MMGHCSAAALTRMLRASGCSADVLEAVKHFQCQACEETRNEQRPPVTKPPKPASQQKFNYEVSLDAFEIHDAAGHRHTILSMVDMATKYHVAVRVAGVGTPTSKSCADAMNNSWISWAGAPAYVGTDQGVHNKGRLSALLTSQGTQIRVVGLHAPFQLGSGERQGGIFKEIMKKAIQERQLQGADVIAALCSETSKVKNSQMNHMGFTFHNGCWDNNLQM